MIPLGDPGTTLGDSYEAPVLELETAPGSGQWRLVPWLGERLRWKYGANDDIPTAEIRLNIADDVDLSPDPGDPDAEPTRDWQLRDTDRLPKNPWEELLGGRRIRIRTKRGEPADDWLAFEGFVERIELGWSGSQQKGGRWLTLFAVDTVIAADREPNQQMFGQWRRHRGAEMLLRAGEDWGPGAITPRDCILAGVPLIFNPKGKPNCHPVPLEFSDQSQVYIFTDPEDPDAIPWTIARCLRYIQWAAFQPAAPAVNSPGPSEKLDIKHICLDRGVIDSRGLWTSYPLYHGNLNELLGNPKTATEVTDYLKEPPDGGGGGFKSACLTRALPDLACEGMSTLEALVYLCDKANILLHVEHEFHSNGLGTTQVHYAAPGARSSGSPPPPNPGGRVILFDPAGEEPVQLQLADTEGVNFYVPSDRTTGDDLSEAEMIAKGNAVEGVLLLDDSGRRSRVRINFDVVQYELTAELRPGWPPDDWWDVDPDDEDAVNAAIQRAQIKRGDWSKRYCRQNEASAATMKVYRNVGRYWVLNEDGACRAEYFKRDAGPWSDEQQWDPFDFAIEGQVRDLERRGANGWSCRRRRFLPTIGTDRYYLGDGEYTKHPQKLDVFVEISFDSGEHWFHGSPSIIEVAKDRCAIMIKVDDLRELKPPSWADVPDIDYVEAYIRGALRVRVTADVEGDDIGYGYGAPDPEAGFAMDWLECLDRRNRYRAILRDRALDVPFKQYEFTDPPSINDLIEADAAAVQLRDEFNRRRDSGHVTVPYILRPRRDVDWPTYRIGNEVDMLQTGRGDTVLLLDRGVGNRRSSPRVVGLTYEWSQDPANCSTSVMLEDRLYDADDIIGPPRVQSEGNT